MRYRTKILNSLAVLAVVGTGGLFLVIALSSDPDPPPNVLVFPEQTVAQSSLAPEATLDEPVVAASDGRVLIEGALCNTGDEVVHTQVTLAFTSPGVGSFNITPQPLPQIRRPGCEWHLEDCPDDLTVLDPDSPAEANGCFPPFANIFPLLLIEETGVGFPWRVTGDVEVIPPGDAQGGPIIASEAFRIRIAR